jgi:hypothetical protein
MARLGVPPYIANKILNHQAGTISGVAAVYQRHDFLSSGKKRSIAGAPTLSGHSKRSARFEIQSQSIAELTEPGGS